MNKLILGYIKIKKDKIYCRINENGLMDIYKGGIIKEITINATNAILITNKSGLNVSLTAKKNIC